MNPRPLFVALLAITMLTFAEISHAQDAVPSSSESILGAWCGTTAISAGKVAKWNHNVLIEKDSILFRRRDSDTIDETWDYTIDATKKPKQITMVRSAGIPDIETGKPQRLNAIFEQSEKEIRIAFLPGRNGSSLEERPIDMTSTKENRSIVLVLAPETGENVHSQDRKSTPNSKPFADGAIVCVTTLNGATLYLENPEMRKLGETWFLVGDIAELPGVPAPPKTLTSWVSLNTIAIIQEHKDAEELRRAFPYHQHSQDHEDVRTNGQMGRGTNGHTPHLAETT